MSDKELAPISVEVVPVEDLENIRLVANADAGKENNVGIGERADAFLGLASDVIDLVEGKQLYKVEVPEGYSLKDLVASKKDPEAVRALIRDPKGRLSGDVSLKATGVSPAQIASIGLAAAAMVVGQAYMTEISDSLQRIDAKLESIASMIAGDQKAKVKNALDIARTYAALHDDYLQKPAEAGQAARNEIEGRYNDVGQVIDWITEQLAGIVDKARDAAEREKDLEPLLKEVQSYEAQLGVRRGVWTTGFSARASFLDSVHTLFAFGAADPFSQDLCSELRYRRSEAILLIRMLAYFDGASCGHARATRLVRFQRCWKYRLNEKPSRHFRGPRLRNGFSRLRRHGA